MANELFVDTSGFYAALCERDEAHEKAAQLLTKAAKQKRRFVTTDYILDETATLLRRRGLSHLEPVLFETVLESRACRMEWMDSARFRQTQRFFLARADHGYSFTDSFSFVLMRDLELVDAMTTDRHFREAGFNALLERYSSSHNNLQCSSG
mgnify:CR=1 FL=1